MINFIDKVGDQLLDVCGLNLRACGKEQAAMVLHQVRDTITMKVQFNPVEYHHSGKNFFYINIKC